jgi:hypothetical protein
VWSTRILLHMSKATESTTSVVNMCVVINFV